MSQAVPLVALLADAMSPLLGHRVLSAPSAHAAYAQSEGHHAGVTPGLVVQPHSIAEVQAVVSSAAALAVPLVVCGANTSLEGNSAAGDTSVLVDLSQMNTIIAVSAEDMLCVVGPGVTREALHAELRGQGLCLSGRSKCEGNACRHDRYPSVGDDSCALWDNARECDGFESGAGRRILRRSLRVNYGPSAP